MSTEFRKGPLTIAQVEAIARLGLLWQVGHPTLPGARPSYFDFVEEPAPSEAQPAPAPVALKIGDSVRLRKFESRSRLTFNPKMQPLVGTVRKIRGFNDLGIQLEGSLWTWRRDAVDLVASSEPKTPPVSAEVPFRALADISLDQIQAHRGEWAEQERPDYFWKFETRADGIWVDFRSSVVSFSQEKEPPDSYRWKRAQSLHFRPVIDGKPVPWEALAVPSVKPISVQVNQAKEKTMPPISAPAPAATQISDPATFIDRFVEASKEGAKRAGVEGGIEITHSIIKDLLIGLGGDMSPREEGIVREFLTRLLRSDYGKALGAYGIGELFQAFTPYAGGQAPLTLAAAAEFRAQAMQVATKTAGADLITKVMPHGYELVQQILRGFGDSLTPKAKVPAVLSPGASTSAPFAHTEAELTIPR